MTKETLFNKLRDKGIFWSYSKDISYQEAGDKLFLEYLLKYGDFDNLVLAFRLYPKEFIKSIWENRLKDDKQFIKLNLMNLIFLWGSIKTKNYTTFVLL